jgi:hypothetical protein
MVIKFICLVKFLQQLAINNLNSITSWYLEWKITVFAVKYRLNLCILCGWKFVFRNRKTSIEGPEE